MKIYEDHPDNYEPDQFRVGVDPSDPCKARYSVRMRRVRMRWYATKRFGDTIVVRETADDEIEVAFKGADGNYNIEYRGPKKGFKFYYAEATTPDTEEDRRMKTPDEVRRILIASCDAWLAAGKRIAPGAFVRRDGSACALGTLGCEGGKDAVEKLDLPYDTVMAIGYGFDGTEWAATRSQAAWYALGRELRERYCK